MDAEGADADELIMGLPPRDRAAVHEAGHALLYLMFGRPLYEVVARPEDGYCAGREPEEDWAKAIVATYGGMAAESIITEFSLHGGTETNEGSDVNTITRRLAGLPMSKREREITSGRALALSVDLLLAVRPALVRLWRELVAQTTMSGAAVQEIAERAMGVEAGGMVYARLLPVGTPLRTQLDQPDFDLRVWEVSVYEAG